MAEQAFGVTAGAGKLLGRMAADYLRVKPDLGRRTRRVWPTGGSSLKLYQYTSTTDYLGSDDQAGVSSTGDCIDADGSISGSAGSGATLDADATYLHQLIAPDGFFWGRKVGSTVYAVSGAPGFTVVTATIDAGLTATTVSGGNSITVTYGSACGTTAYVEGQQVVLMWSGNAFFVIDECCPPGLGT